MRTFAVLLALTAALGPAISPAGAQPAQRCTHETFPIGGQPVAVTLCAGVPDGKTLALAETYKGAAASFSRTGSLEIVSGAQASRGVEDVSLAPLGLNYTLHLTLAYRAGAVAIEHALLLPGATPLK